MGVGGRGRHGARLECDMVSEVEQFWDMGRPGSGGGVDIAGV